MGLIDVETMNQLRQRLDDAGFSHVILYGEPWDAGSNQIIQPNIPANKSNVWALSEGVAVFSNDLRDSIKGDVFEETDGAFIQGMNGQPQVKQTFMRQIWQRRFKEIRKLLDKKAPSVGQNRPVK